MTQDPGPARWPALLPLIALACLVSAVFFPVLGFELVDLDVEGMVVEDPDVRGVTWGNLKRIFTSRSASRSYYPVRRLSYAIDYHFWNGRAEGFKLSNTLIHLANVLLVYWLILRILRHPARRARAPSRPWETAAAAFSAGIFAVHPVVVEPVTWVAGREELLMTLGALGCLHWHITGGRLEDEGDRTLGAAACYVAAAFCCLVACLSNAVGAVIPLLIFAWDALTLVRPTLWRVLSRTAGLWAIGLLTIGVKMAGEDIDVASPARIFSAEWFMIVLNLYWLNLKTLVWPTKLAVFYSNVRPGSFADTEVMLGAIAAGLTCLAVWKLRRQKLILFGLLWFALASAPAGSHIIPHHIHRADRFLYLPLAGLTVAVALGLGRLAGAWKGRTQAALVVAGGLGLTLICVASAAQVRTWRDAVSMWEQCTRAEPNDAANHCALADNLAKSGRFREAARQYERALELSPDAGRVLTSLAWLLGRCDDRSVRDYDRAILLAKRAYDQDPGSFRTLAAVYAGYAAHLAGDRQFERAIEHYDMAIRLYPDDPALLLEFASLLATCDEKRLRIPDEAVRLAESACRLTAAPDARGLGILAAAYAEAGRLDRAVTTAEQALAQARAAGEEQRVGRLQGRLKLYRERMANQKMP